VLVLNRRKSFLLKEQMAHQTYSGTCAAARVRGSVHLLPLAVLVGYSLSAQTTVDLHQQSRNVDFSNASSTRVWKTGTSLPAQCGVGEGFFLSNATAGQNLYLCTSPGVWAATTPSGAGSGSQLQTISGTFQVDAVPSIDVTGTAVSSGCTAALGSITCGGGVNSGTGPSRITATEGVAPQNPASGQQTLYLDATDHNLKSIDANTAVHQYATTNGVETISSKTFLNPSLGNTSITTRLPNETSIGTVANKLAKLVGSPASAIVASVSDTVGITGVVVNGAGVSGSAEIATAGQATCLFDGATTAGDYVTISSIATGSCHDSGTAYPTGLQIVGRVLSTNGAGGVFPMELFGSEVRGSSASAGASFDPLDFTTAWWRDEMTTNYQWFVYTDPGGAVLSGDPVFGDNSHPGVFQLQTGAVVNYSAYILYTWANGAMVMQYPSGLSWDMVWVVKLAGLSGANYSVGFTDSRQHNALTIAYRPSLGADWFGISRNSDVETVVDLGVPASTSAWAKLKLRSDGTIIYFSANGSPEKTLCATGCNAIGVTGLPATEVEPYASVIAQAPAQQSLGVDFFALQIRGLSR
jgi:hypothetical protein